MKPFILTSLLFLAAPAAADEFNSFRNLKEAFQDEIGLCRDRVNGTPCAEPRGYDIQLIIPRACGGELDRDNIWMIPNEIMRSKKQAERSVDGVPCAGLEAWLNGAMEER